jgi:hypothetical protein
MIDHRDVGQEAGALLSDRRCAIGTGYDQGSLPGCPASSGLPRYCARLTGSVIDGEGKLAALGVNMATYGRLAYVQRTDEYPTLQQVAEIAFFYEYEAIIVPNARWPASNVVIFTEHTRPSQIAVTGSEAVDLAAWDKAVRDAGTL